MITTPTMLIPFDDQRDLLIYAFRYALGRRTYAVRTVVDILHQSWPLLSDGDKGLYCREIRKAIELDRAGMDFDKKAWQSILELEGK